MNKTTIVLCIYDDLLNGNKINSGICRKSYGISETTFYRYISIIRAHIWESQMIDVVFDVKKQTYLLEKNTVEISRNCAN